MEKEKSYSEICKDLLALLKTFKKAYFETKKDLYDLSAQEEENEQEEQQAKEKKNEREEQGKVEQGKKAANLQEHVAEGNLDTQQIDSGITSTDEQIKKGGGKRRKASSARSKKKVWIRGFWNKWNGEMKSRRPMGNVIRLGIGEEGRKGRGRKGSYKTRRKKKKERVKLMDWNFKENG